VNLIAFAVKIKVYFGLDHAAILIHHGCGSAVFVDALAYYGGGLHGNRESRFVSCGGRYSL
jgi:hypothetical protein